MALIVPGRLVFMHVPKTGGTWIKTVLRSQIGGVIYTKTNHGNPWAKAGHPDLEDVKDIDGFRIGFVRHPVDWWLSFWRHRQRRGGKWNLELQLDRDVMSKSFDQYVRNILDKRPGYASRMFSEFVGDPGNEIDFIGKQENLIPDLKRALKRAGYDPRKLTFGEGRKNAGGKKTAHYRFNYEQRRALSQAEVEGIDRFGYERWH